MIFDGSDKTWLGCGIECVGATGCVRVNNCDVSSSLRINGIAMSVLLYLEGRANRAVCRLVKTFILSLPDAALRVFEYMCLSLRRKCLSVVQYGCLETSVVP